jgi:hypothetical protein
MGWGLGDGLIALWRWFGLRHDGRAIERDHDLLDFVPVRPQLNNVVQVCNLFELHDLSPVAIGDLGFAKPDTPDNVSMADRPNSPHTLRTSLADGRNLTRH